MWLTWLEILLGKDNGGEVFTFKASYVFMWEHIKEIRKEIKNKKNLGFGPKTMASWKSL